MSRVNRYIDKYGQTWKLASVNVCGYDNFYLVRESDGNIGGWFNGDGLVAL